MSQIEQNLIYPYKNNLYINLTNRCTNNCIFCNKELLQKVVSKNLILKKEPTAEEVINCIKKYKGKYNEVVFCGIGEPLLRLNTLLKICEYLKKRNKKIRVNTNGQAKLIHPGRDVAYELKKSGVRSVRISLNALDNKEYIKRCRPNVHKKNKYNIFKKIIEFAKECKKNKIRTTLTFVGDDLNRELCRKLAKRLKLNCKIRKELKEQC